MPSPIITAEQLKTLYAAATRMGDTAAVAIADAASSTQHDPYLYAARALFDAIVPPRDRAACPQETKLGQYLYRFVDGRWRAPTVSVCVEGATWIVELTQDPCGVEVVASPAIRDYACTQLRGSFHPKITAQAAVAWLLERDRQIHTLKTFISKD